MSSSKSKAAYRNFELFRSNDGETLVIHYSRQNLEDNESGAATPRIIAIFVKSLDGKLNECFAINHEAEKNKVVFDQIANYYDELESRVIKNFVNFIKRHRNYRWLHWNMNDVYFSFEAIEHRYKVLISSEGKDFVEVPFDKRYNINQLLKEIYGNDYEEEPQFDNLVKSNNRGVLINGYLSIAEEARAFGSMNFNKIVESLRCKVNFLIDVIDKTHDRSLIVSNRGVLRAIGDFVTHPITAMISFILTILGFVLAIVVL